MTPDTMKRKDVFKLHVDVNGCSGMSLYFNLYSPDVPYEGQMSFIRDNLSPFCT